MSVNEITEEIVMKQKRTEKKDDKRLGLRFDRFFTEENIHPYDKIEWEHRHAKIANDKGEVIFEQKEVEMPRAWSQMATDVVVSKYFHGKIGTPERETGLKQLIDRVVNTITAWGKKDGYFGSPEDAVIYSDELTHILVNQYASFNSPVWFNVGVEDTPQCSACFINSVEDSMESILGLAKTEGMLFKHGSGTGTNFSSLRSSKENVKGGGIASGPVSFMKGFDAFAGVIKSGGKTRRAAKMVILDVEHPDIEEFILCKWNEEKKAHVLIDNGYDGGMGGEAYGSIFFQNSNNSVRVNNQFMKAVVKDKKWVTRAVTNNRVVDTYRARDLMRKISEAAHACGDPGLQFDTTVNEWHTCRKTTRINASNPCSEFMFIDNSACNLSSLNLMKFIDEEDNFMVNEFCHAINVLVTAMDIVVDRSSYPTDKIKANSMDYRPLGLGYANLGALLMSRGFPYDSDEGRAYAAAITALMTGQAYKMSALISRALGAFKHFEANKESVLQVIQMHRYHLTKIEASYVPDSIYSTLQKVWNEANHVGFEYGYRNAQVSVLAPTGTIGFMMDCDTTGIEPDISLIKYKKLVGGGVLKIINRSVARALKNLGHSADEVQDILRYLEENEKIEGAPHLNQEYLQIFDCAFKPKSGVRSIHYMGHIRMMAAVQPFISGAISKTVNMPAEATPEEVMETFIEAWQLGLKSITIYRDGSKRTQPLTTSLDSDKKEVVKGSGATSSTAVRTAKPYRRRLPAERPSITHKFSIAGHEGYITVGMYDDGTPGEIFVRMAKEGSVVSGLVDAFATGTSIMLQYGVPLDVLVNKFSHTRFEPSGFTNNQKIPIAKSILDYIFRWLSLKFITKEDMPIIKNGVTQEIEESQEIKKVLLKKEEKVEKGKAEVKGDSLYQAEIDAPPCPDCGSIMIRNGACHKCINCGATNGCS
ncbi:MAG: ribonucleoside-diphosphate reductase, adenosylcobalamin-dependent [Elusimicrobia bacterium RIFOXYB2_FULL_49_7]|nr:MAG: ribonucleoside-diphosphate reductase, adenosylcobalamin-dependent [Elusimicrobia bacterium RIFOXYB2_FULL_49_7]